MPVIDYSKSNVLYGTRRPDLIEALGGSDTVYGRAENDELYGGRGNDRLFGEAGDDLLDGGRGEDAMDGGNGDDAYYVENVKDQTIEVRSTGGTDQIYASVDWTLGEHFENLRLYRGAEFGTGNSLDNIIEGSGYDNTMHGLGGSDTLIGNNGDDVLKGGRGNDTIWGGGDDAIVEADQERYDFVPEDDGADVISGGRGSDTLALQDAYFVYEDGFEYYENSRALDAVVDIEDGSVSYENDGQSDDRLISIENVRAASGDDRIYGDDGNNTIRAGDGQNIACGRGGNDTIIGGVGAEDGWPYIEKLYGGDGDDVLISGGAFYFYERSGESEYWATDYMSGGDGNDRLVSGFGSKEMRGGDGSDQFEFTNELIGLAEGGWGYGESGMQASILDFRRSHDDQIVVDMIEDEFSYGFQGTPEWVGETDEVGQGQIGYRQTIDDDGETDTIVTLRLVEGSETVPNADLTITVEDYAYSLRESDFLFV